MAQATLYGGRELLQPNRQRVRIDACVHEVVWVVEVASRRVIRGVCLSCEPSVDRSDVGQS